MSRKRLDGNRTGSFHADMLPILIQSHECWGGDTRRDQDLDWRRTCALVGVVLLRNVGK